MKVDKEFLIKNHFWILLFTAAALSLLGWLLLLVTVPGTVSAERKKIMDEWEKGKKHNNYKHPEYVTRAQALADRRDKERSQIHETLFADQVRDARLNTWPRKMVEVDGFDFNDGKYATEIVVKADNKETKRSSYLGTLTNDATHIHGRLKGESENHFIVIETALPGDKKLVKILKTPNVKVTSEDAKETNLSFLSLQKGDLTGRILSVTFATGKYFGDELTVPEIKSYVEWYKEQLVDVLAEAGPLNALGQPILQFHYTGEASAGGKGGGTTFGGPRGGKGGIAPGGIKNGEGAGSGSGKPAEEDFGPETWIYHPGKLPPASNRFFPYVEKWDENLTDISTEIWAAQENLWIQRELFKRIKLANDAVARFSPAYTPPHDPKDAKAREAALKPFAVKDQWVKFTNFYWELDLKIVGEGVQAKLKNLRPRRQSLDGLKFQIKFSLSPNEQPQLFPPTGAAFESVPLGPNDTHETAVFPMAGVKLDGLFVVDQVLTWETAAIKRLDVLAIGMGAGGDPAVSQRQSWMPLLPFKKKPKEEAAAADKTGGPDNKGPRGMNMGGGGGKNAAPAGYGKHEVLVERYLEVSGELRRVPINLVLIIDPDHIAKVEKTFAESPLRFLTTQVMWQRSPTALRPPESVATGGDNKGPSPGGMPKGGLGGARPGTFGGGPTGPGAGQPATELAAGGDERENLELTIYGIVTLYDRPARPPAVDQAK